MMPSGDRTTPAFATALGYWLRLGLTSFGGPAGQIAMMQSELVDRRGWIDQRRFLEALNFCMLLPGPEAQQLATFVGWRLHGIRGGLAAGLLFVLPGAVVLMALSWIAAAHGDVAAVSAVFQGVTPVVVAIIAAALWRIARRTLTGWAPIALAVAAFLGLAVAGVPFPAIVLGAGVIGWIGGRVRPALFGRVPEGEAPPPDPAGRALARLLRLVAICAVLWAVPVGLVVALLGSEPWADIATLFTKAAFVTFGGAYAVLPYIAEAATGTYGWLSPEDMIRGLALAETTPGPLILVTQFVGFFAGWSAPGGWPPALAGTVAALLTLYVTFLPCFLFIFAGAPYVERLSHDRRAASALGAITAAVVGVILNLGVFLAGAAFWPGAGAGAALTAMPDPFAVAVAVVALAAMLRFGVAVPWMVLAGAATGLARAAATGGL
ncbi:MAG: chromate efflux transporter [Azospirillaceae bacterium]